MLVYISSTNTSLRPSSIEILVLQAALRHSFLSLAPVDLFSVHRRRKLVHDWQIFVDNGAEGHVGYVGRRGGDELVSRQ